MAVRTSTMSLSSGRLCKWQRCSGLPPQMLDGSLRLAQLPQDAGKPRQLLSMPRGSSCRPAAAAESQELARVKGGASRLGHMLRRPSAQHSLGVFVVAVLCGRGRRGAASSSTSTATAATSCRSTGSSTSTAAPSTTRGLETLGASCINSWLRELEPDPEQESNIPNRSSRQVRSGHYVLVDPMPLEEPYLVTHSEEMLEELGLTEEDAQSDTFAHLFSGDLEGLPGFESWATPYALSIYGNEMYQNCPFGNGNGYGDGRALSIGEVVGADEERWELQLKGAGRTPFCRGGDGRAVLRSSVREFLASEAMHHLGVPTTRAVSLVASGTETTMRPWYSDVDASAGNVPESFDLDGMLKRLLMEQREVDFDSLASDLKESLRGQLRAQLSGSSREPNQMVKEPLAITCRAARSFVRVGHLELFARRARGGGAAELRQLELVVQHAIDREYPHLASHESLPKRALEMLREASGRIAHLAAEWIRVGYVQGNFNSDNCLVAGRTMDYGPFGFIEKYEPMWNMWTGGGDKYGFLNQPNAAYKNLESLAQALVPVLSTEGLQEEAVEILKGFTDQARRELSEVWRKKLGLPDGSDKAAELFGGMEPLLRASNADYTLFWRCLADVATCEDADDYTLLAPLQPCFQDPLNEEGISKWAAWLRQWREAITSEGRSAQDAAAQMRLVSPKYIPREWMLVRAYSAAGQGDTSVVKQLQRIFKDPYGEQPEVEEEYFRLTPSEAKSKGGVSWMT